MCSAPRNSAARKSTQGEGRWQDIGERPLLFPRVTPVWGAPTPGSFGTWAGIARKIPTITRELPNDLSGPQCWQANRDALTALLQTAPADLAK